MREMKDSGVAWIGDIPTHWSVLRNKNLIFEINDRCDANTTLPLLSVSEYYGVAPKAERIEEGQILSRAESLEGYKICQPNDIAMNIMLAWKRAQAVSKYHGIISPAYCVYRKREDAQLNMDYFHYLIRSDLYINVFKRYSTGIIESRLRLYPEKFLALHSHLPPVEEQERIALTLDKKCAQVDILITNVQVQIEKLKAYKQSLITEAVTKGLDPTVPMKDSGVEWIGEIPEHWNVAKARRIITSTQNGMTRRDLTESKGQIVLKLKNISADGGIDYSYINRIALSEKELETYALKDGDFLFVRVNGSKGLVGKCAIFTDNGEITAYNDHIIRVRINTLCSKEYFHYYLLSGAGKTEIEHHTSTSAGQYTISGEGLRDIWLVLPPKDIQESLCSFLNEKCGQIDRLITIKQAKIEKLEQYKKSLIYEYVTGKREVN